MMNMLPRRRAVIGLSLIAGYASPSFAVVGADGGVGAGHVVQLVFGLVIVVVAIFATAFLLRRVGRFSGSPNNPMRVVGGLNVGTRERVLLIEVGDRQLVIGVAPGRVQTLHVLEHPVSNAPNTPTRGIPMSGQTFAERLGQALRKGVGK